MKKKILSALLVGAMVSSLLAGCGGSDSASTSDTPSVTVKEKIVYKEPEVLDDLRKIDLNTLTPIAALNLLFELKNKI